MSTITKAWTFASSSSDKTYQTLQYDDGSTSCNCPGWTRRVADDGSRSCRHTRGVDMGTADSECVASKDYGSTPIRQTPQKAKAKPVIQTEPDEPTKIIRKVSWR